MHGMHFTLLSSQKPADIDTDPFTLVTTNGHRSVGLSFPPLPSLPLPPIYRHTQTWPPRPFLSITIPSSLSYLALKTMKRLNKQPRGSSPSAPSSPPPGQLPRPAAACGTPRLPRAPSSILPLPPAWPRKSRSHLFLLPWPVSQSPLSVCLSVCLPCLSVSPVCLSLCLSVCLNTCKWCEVCFSLFLSRYQKR